MKDTSDARKYKIKSLMSLTHTFSGRHGPRKNTEHSTSEEIDAQGTATAKPEIRPNTCKKRFHIVKEITQYCGFQYNVRVFL